MSPHIPIGVVELRVETEMTSAGVQALIEEINSENQNAFGRQWTVTHMFVAQQPNTRAVLYTIVLERSR